MEFDRILEASPTSLCVIDNKTGEIVVCSDGEKYDFRDESMIALDEQRTACLNDEIQAGYFGGGILAGGVYFEKIEMFYRYSIYAYTPLNSVLQKALITIIPEYAFMLLSLAYAWYCAMQLRKHGKAFRIRSSTSSSPRTTISTP